MDPAEVAPLLCAGVTVFNSIRNMHIVPGGTVAIQGLGGLGHLALQYSNKMGYRTVALSRDASKKDFATKLGATDYVDGSKEDTAEALQKLGGADLIVVTAPNPKIMGPLVKGLGPLGKLLILARKSEFGFVNMINADFRSGRRGSRGHGIAYHQGTIGPRLAIWTCTRQRGGHRVR